MRSSIALLPVLGLAGAGPPWAPKLNLGDITTSNVSVPSWSVVGSVSPTFTDNALFSRDDRRADVYYEPDISLRLDGYLTNDLSYRLYARSQYEAFATERDSNVAIARVGGRL